MNKVNLHDEFVKSLQDKIPNKKELIDTISDILKLEKEPASRRLHGKVQFSVREMGVLATELGILLDALLHKDKHYQWVPFSLGSPMSVKSFDVISDSFNTNLTYMERIAQDSTEYGCLFHIFPIEFYAYQPHLMKFMFFKWGHYLIGTEEFNNYAQWEVPESLKSVREKVDKIYTNVENVLYIWDNSLIWTLVREIDYFYKMRIINIEDKENIKSDLKNLLTQFEKYLKDNLLPNRSCQNISFYVSHVNIGTSSMYLCSPSKQISLFQNSFSFSDADESYESLVNIKEWINSFKNISALISGSGSLERRKFFKEQHEIIDMVLS